MDFLHIFVAFSLTCGLKAEGPPGGANERLVLGEVVANWLTCKTVLEKWSLLFISSNES